MYVIFGNPLLSVGGGTVALLYQAWKPMLPLIGVVGSMTISSLRGFDTQLLARDMVSIGEKLYMIKANATM